MAASDPRPDPGFDLRVAWQQLDSGTQIGLGVAGSLLLLALLILITPRPGALRVGGDLLPTAAMALTPSAASAAAVTSIPPTATPTTTPAAVALTEGVLRADGAADVALYWEPNKAEATRLAVGTTVTLHGFWDDWVAVSTPNLAQLLWVRFANVDASVDAIAALRDWKPRPTAAPAPPRPQAAPAWNAPPAPVNTPSDLVALPTDTTPEPTRVPGAPASCVRTNGGGMCPAKPIPTMDPNATWPSQINVNP